MLNARDAAAARDAWQRFEVARTAGDYKAMDAIMREESFFLAGAEEGARHFEKTNCTTAEVLQKTWAMFFVLRAQVDITRTLALSLRSDIAALKKEADTIRLAYRGTYKDGETYKRGDYATFGGSLWHANEPTESRPGTGPTWTLVVQRGRDGKDANGQR